MQDRARAVEKLARRQSTRWPSDGDELAVLAPGDPQSIADLTDRGVGLDGLDDRGQQVVSTPRGVLEALERPRPGRRIALGADSSDALDLTALPFRIDPLELRRDAG